MPAEGIGPHESGYPDGLLRREEGECVAHGRCNQAPKIVTVRVRPSVLIKAGARLCGARRSDAGHVVAAIVANLATPPERVVS